MSSAVQILRAMTFSVYDLQMLRIQTGLRLCANFRSKLGLIDDPTTKDEEKEEAKKIIVQLKQSYTRLTDGIARNRTLPEESGFVGDELISTYTELVLVDQYMRVEKNERQQFNQFDHVLKQIPIYNEYLKDVVGIGPAMSAVLISYFDPAKAERISDFWAYAGLDLGPDGRGRSRRAEHLIDREYKKKDGTIDIKKSVTYNPWLKARLFGALATSFMRTENCPWKKVYDGYKHRILTSPTHVKVSLEEYKKLHKDGDPKSIAVWPPLRVHNASMRYMIKMFLAEFWIKWRTVEGLPVTLSYHEEVLGHKHVA